MNILDNMTPQLALKIIRAAGDSVKENYLLVMGAINYKESGDVEYDIRNSIAAYEKARCVFDDYKKTIFQELDIYFKEIHEKITKFKISALKSKYDLQRIYFLHNVIKKAYSDYSEFIPYILDHADKVWFSNVPNRIADNEEFIKSNS
jgi:hypothetical protein